ncbi:non-ribosomal peptide synthetase [Sporofaciens musculi]|uniref:non-ribosomal peptide synthetase n=1 Tax=Sporofaciens musculi TaxID=2681861 RepID=UPI00258B8F78|nr:non-ribosomal peptide synthetase [Sporofaciens musculi]
MNFLDEFQSMVRRYPDKTAIVDRGGRRTTTYRELDALSRRIAAKLAQSGEISGQAVLVCMDRRMEYAAAEIGVLMAGAAFAPVLPEYPKERLDYIQEDCQAAVRIDADWLRDVGRYEEASPVRVADENRAMLIYTSGSTGRPKGIVHSMASLTQGIMRVRSILYLEDKDVVAAMAPMSFVVLVMEYFGTLSCGACTHIVPEEIRKDVRMIEDYFVEYDITCAFFSPQIMKFFKNKGGTLKKVATGSERVSRLSGDGFELYNVYGCSETAMIASYYKIDEPMENTPIGKPAQGLKFFVLDENGNEVADEEDGELCIKGILGEAYLNLEEQSARTFQKQEDGEVLIHTGDIVRRLKDGNYLYVNRKDWMVKINGQRVETGEIEIKMSSMEGVENAVVKAFSDENGQNYLCGYYVAKPEIMSEQLRAFLRDSLPEYMIPRFFKRLDALPKNVNGKLDRTVLLPPGPEEYKARYHEPKNDVERRLCSGFEEVLHCGKTGREDDFFRLGGDSINVLQLLECLSELPMTPEMVLRGRTPEMIAELLNADEAEKIEKVCGKRDVYPLTDSQMGVYLECVNDPEATMYNIPMCCELPKKIDLNRFKEAVGLAVARHTSFGVNIALDNGAPVMCLHPEFQRADLKEWEVEDIEAVKKTFVRPFCMEGEPLYRMALYRCKGRCYFLFDVHHLIFDGTSVKVFLDEVSLLYQGEEPKPEEISLTDLAVYEETLKETPRYQSAREYFKGRFAGVDIEEMLIKDFRKKVITPRSKAVRQACGEEVSCMAVEQFVRQKGISENTLFLGAFSYVLAKLSGLNKSFFCTVNNGRHTTKLAQSTGMFVRTLPVSHSFEERMAVDEYLKGFQEDFYELMSHDCISFAELARDYGIASDILFVYQGEMLNGLTFAGEKYPAKPIPAGDVQANISVMVMKNQEGYEISLEYRTDLYREETARGLLRMMQQTLQGMLSCLTLKEIALASELDLQVLDGFNDTEKLYDRSKTVVDLFREQAKKTPERTAVVYCNRRYTYAGVDEITDRLAAYVAEMGIGNEQVVSVLIPRCEYMAIASLGVSKAGAAYQPLDPSYPKDRLEFMMKDADAKLLIADKELLPLVPNFQGKVLLTEDIFSLPKVKQLPKPPKPEDLFILLYTSGSTGVPKGCMLEHGNIAAFCHWYSEYYGLTKECKVAAYASYGFDANMMDMYPALTVGAETHIIEENIRLDLNGLNQYFEKQGITHIFMTTQIGRAFATSMKNGKLMHLAMGGEALAPFTPKGNTKYYNIYGPTECTVNVTVYPLERYEDEFPIGKAISNIKLYVLDSQGRRAPVGMPGELCIAGYQVSRGYLNRPDKTKEVYSSNPFCALKGYDRLYHTGDIVRFLPDGSIQFIGRRDGQVKVRGFRIELSEVEEVIRRFPGITDATVAAFDEPAGGKYIAAYVVSEGEVDVDALNAFIEESKPPYMVPAVTMQIDKIPLNQNQKVNKRALPVPERRQEELAPPKNETQQKIFDCIAEVIGHKEFGVTTDIYRAGLTSIGAVKLNVLLSQAFDGAVIRNKDLKENDTVEKLEQFLAQSQGEEAFTKQEAYPLTQTQNGIFVECAANPGSTIYNIPFLFRLGEKVDLGRLKKALEDTVEAHPYIKTTLYMDDNGDIWQKRNDELPFEVEICQSMCKEDLVKPYQLILDRLFRICLFDTPEGKYLFLEFHHIISDGESCGIFLRDMNRAYEGGGLTKESFTGFEAALVEQKALKGEEYVLAKRYYDSVFEGCDTDFLPARDHREASPGLGVYKRTDTLKLDALKKFCEEQRITMNTLFTAAFGFVVGRYVYKDEAVFTTIYNGRNDSRLASVMNMLVKTLPVYCNLDGEKEVGDYLRETGEQLMNSMNSDIYSFAEISRAYNIKADLMFAFQGDNFQFDEIAGEKAVLQELSLDTAKAPLSVDVLVENGGIVYQAEYRSDMYEERTVAGLMESLSAVVLEFQTKKQLKEVSMVSGKARRELDSYNETDYEVEQTTANLLFERQAALYPDKTAVIACGTSLTFRQLNENANKIANYLIDMGLKIEQMVGVMLPRTVEVYAARQGIMKAGGAFLPIDPEYPDERISYILEDSKAEFLLLPESLAKERKMLLDKLSVKAIFIDQLLSSEGKTENPHVDIRPDNLCYCIYTSGSTGKPKGVMIEHQNLVNYVDDNRFNVEAQAYVYNATVSLAFAAITFDVSILEECIPLYHGITVCMANEEEIHNPLALSSLILKNGVDILTCTPSFLINIIDMPEMKKSLSQIKMFNVGAEAFPEALYDKIRALGTEAIIFNGYGPTETTIGCAFDQMTGEKVTIGKPMANIKMVMIDRYRNLLPAGAPGELLIIGNGVGRGYVGKPEMTADKFIQFEGRRAYRSGDLAKWNHHGKIEFMGRMDNQVKLRGLRVELDEIENVMNQYPTVKSSVVLVKEKDSIQFLCGYFVAESQIDRQKLTCFMQKYLTPYMVPSVLMQLPELPLTNNGKVNKRALPEPEYTTENQNYVKPRTELQRKLCEIFEMALGAEQIGIEDDFFENGGTSLSASKVAMKCMSAGLPVSYADLFDYKTPLSLERHIQELNQAESEDETEGGEDKEGSLEKILGRNSVEYVDEIRPSKAGSILLTGANGFLGAHILKHLIDNGDQVIYCLLRKGKALSLETRLKSMLVYYFSNPYEELFGSRIRLIEGDITDSAKVDGLKVYDFEQIINCAACVKHFSADDTLEKVNYQGVLNLIHLCKETGRELIQISTVSIAGENVAGRFPVEKRLHENELYFGQSLTNKYIDTKFRAEKAVLEAALEGMKGKVIRVGNLMSRVSDGEFQINSVTNGFMRTLRGYVALGKFPVSMLDMPAEFSPIDSTAEAIVRLASSEGDFTVFHAYSSYLIQMADVIEQMNQSGIKVEIVSDEEFQKALEAALENEEKNELISGLIAYSSSDKDNSSVYIDADNGFTTKALYRLGFKWPMPDGDYLKNALTALETLGFFDGRI